MPTRHELGLAWEDNKLLRRRMKDRKEPYMTRWVSQSAINVPSVKAMVLNSKALEALARWWCPCISFPKAVSIDLLREEVARLFFKISSQISLSHSLVWQGRFLRVGFLNRCGSLASFRFFSEVKKAREECGVEVEDQGSIHVDASGLKKLFSHGIRRFCSPAVSHRVTYIEKV